MIGRNSESDQSVRHRQVLIHVYYGILDFLHHTICRVESGWAGADNSKPKGLVVLSRLIAEVATRASSLSEVASNKRSLQSSACKLLRATWASIRCCAEELHDLV